MIMTQAVGFMEFFKPLDAEPLLFCDSQSATAVSKTSEVRPKCRHFALRFHRVRDEAHRIAFCPTTLQKADALTKAVSAAQRRLLFHHTTDPVPTDDGDGEATAFLVACVPVGIRG